MKNKKDSFLLEKETWKKKMNKKGSEGTTWTIIVIILALIVLVVLVVGFTSGWGNLWDKMKAFFGGGPNVDTIVQACGIACSTGAKYDYCTSLRDVRFEDKTRNGKYNCKAVEGASVGLSSCDFDSCGELKFLKTDKCTDSGGTWQTGACADGKEDLTRNIGDKSDKGTNDYCCKS